MNFTKEQFFRRQTIVQEFGETGQQKLQNAKVLIVGCGGLGNSAAVYLAASGIGHLHLIDFDTIDISNLHRQVFFKTSEIGASKSAALAKHMEQIAPYVKVTFSNEPISKLNVFTSLENFDIIVDCTDSLAIKYLLNDACVLNDKPLVYGSLYKFDGYIASFNVLDISDNRTANLRDAFPEIPTNNIPNCSEIGTLNPVVGIIGLMQANEVIKIISGIGKPLVNQILIFNSLDNSQFHMRLKSKITKADIAKIFAKSDYLEPNCEIQEPHFLLEKESFKQKINNNNTTLISVIEDVNHPLPFSVDFKIPLTKFSEWIASKETREFIKQHPNNEIVILCKKGISSYTATKIWKNTYKNAAVFSLKNGIDAYE
jgi:adenylyltransferase/sulfurtransferase